ncbi:MAG: alpha/beta hydrolase [Pseudanabaenaceae cyanobacterium bins.39]|nr:alpha/beta hydrolase [Pseudanabaenaceae cyanobacterium bins.39]
MTFRQSRSPQVIGLCTSQPLRRFDLPLLRSLSRQYEIAQWEFCQDLDEPISLEAAVATLDDYVRSCNQPVHLVGHGIAGLVGWLYAKQYPEQVRSLTMLSVSHHLATSWHSHYYAQRQLLGCSRETILLRTAFELFGYRDREMLQWLANLLKEDLDHSLIPHSLYNSINIPLTQIAVPMLVCGAADDYVSGSRQHDHSQWRKFLKDGDRLWFSSEGRHFFHYHQWQAVSNQIRCFWHSLSRQPQTETAFMLPQTK